MSTQKQVGRPVERDTYLPPEPLMGIPMEFPRTSVFARLAGVDARIVNRMLEQQPCHAQDVARVQLAWNRYNSRAIQKQYQIAVDNGLHQLAAVVGGLYEHTTGRPLFPQSELEALLGHAPK